MNGNTLHSWQQYIRVGENYSSQRKDLLQLSRQCFLFIASSKTIAWSGKGYKFSSNKYRTKIESVKVANNTGTMKESRVNHYRRRLLIIPSSSQVCPILSPSPTTKIRYGNNRTVGKKKEGRRAMREGSQQFYRHYHSHSSTTLWYILTISYFPAKSLQRERNFDPFKITVDLCVFLRMKFTHYHDFLETGIDNGTKSILDFSFESGMASQISTIPSFFSQSIDRKVSCHQLADHHILLHLIESLGQVRDWMDTLHLIEL